MINLQHMKRNRHTNGKLLTYDTHILISLLFMYCMLWYSWYTNWYYIILFPLFCHLLGRFLTTLSLHA